jgi:TatD DNase family protein
VGNQKVTELVDTHCHLNFATFDDDRRNVVERARENGIYRILIPGIDIETSKSAINCTHEFNEVYATVGIHPNMGYTWTTQAYEDLRELASHRKVVAIGEIGLDYYRERTPKAQQHSIFKKQLELAANLGKPVIIHNREASEDILKIIQDWYKGLKNNCSRLAENPGVMHSFSGDSNFAKEIVSYNFKIGITGPITFKNSLLLQEIVRSHQVDHLLVETDAPYLTPSPLRGKRNEPANVRIVVEKIAELKDSAVDVIAKITTAGADRLFGWREIL